MNLEFTKMNGAGNDFIMLDNRQGTLALTHHQIAKLCDRHRGIGADGVLILEKGTEAIPLRMRYYNADGHEAEMCGNGARCFTRYVAALLGQLSGTIKFETKAGIVEGELLKDQEDFSRNSTSAANCCVTPVLDSSGMPYTFRGLRSEAPFTSSAEASLERSLVKLLMSNPHSIQLAQSVQLFGQDYAVHSINTGVPHVVIFVPDINTVSVLKIGRELRHHPRFAPAGTNVNFVQVLDPHSLALRTYERGVEDETLACGTGVVASALIHHLLSKTPSPINVLVRGGDTLQVDFAADSENLNTTTPAIKQVTLIGPADFVFTGVYQQLL